jgi:tripeptide aminopeptidase
MKTPLVDLFLQAVKIDAQSLQEHPMAEFVRTALSDVPVKIIEDETGKKITGNSGNLICVPEHFKHGEPAIALFAHLDTPRSTKNVSPRVTETMITSDGTTILGVDNRAGTSLLLNLLQNSSKQKHPANYIVVFTVAEEIGLFGSMHVDLTPYNVKMGFVFDCSKRPGTFIRAAVGCSLYQSAFIGKSSHAAVAPEQGVNSIHIAAKALSKIQIGRHSSSMTSNIGMISGGEATNVVPDRCLVVGEVRSFDPAAIVKHLDELESLYKTVAQENGGTVEFTSKIDFAPFSLSPDDQVMKVTSKVLQHIGLTPNPIEYVGGSDANMLNAKGIPTVNLGIGAQKPHSNEEFILLEDLEKSAEFAAALVTHCEFVD